MGGVSYKEVEESTGLLESGSSEDEDEEIRMINGFDTALPLSDQITLNLSGMKQFMFGGGVKGSCVMLKEYGKFLIFLLNIIQE